MTTTLRREYTRFRQGGGTAKGALYCAKTVVAWREMEQAGLVRVKAEPEQESYFDVYGEPEGYEGANGRRVTAEQERKELIESFERDGLWFVTSEYFDGRTWCQADSIGMIDLPNPLCPYASGGYVTDLMQAALDRVAQCGEH